MAATRPFFDHLLAISPAITDDAGYTHPELARRYAALCALPEKVAAQAFALVRGGWSASWAALLAEVTTTPVAATGVGGAGPAAPHSA